MLQPCLSAYPHFVAQPAVCCTLRATRGTFQDFVGSVLRGPALKSDFVMLSSAKDSWTSGGCVSRAREDASLSWAANVSVKHQTLDFVCKHELCVERGAWQHWQKTDTVGPSELADWFQDVSAASLSWLTVWQGDKTCIALGMFRQAWDALCLHILSPFIQKGAFPPLRHGLMWSFRLCCSFFN